MSQISFTGGGITFTGASLDFLPGAPIIGTATATGDADATVTFISPAYNGGTPIISYTAVASPGGVTSTVYQSGSGTITFNNLAPNTTYTFTVYATNKAGNSVASSASNSITTGVYTSQIEYTVPGTYYWVVPQNVTSVSIFVVGPGGSGGGNGGGGGGGGGSAYTNNLTVTPGANYTIQVGSPGENGNPSYVAPTPTFFANSTFLYGSGGSPGSLGAWGTAGGGGGAAGYSGVGGSGGSATSSSYAGGAGGSSGGTAATAHFAGGAGGLGGPGASATTAAGDGQGGGAGGGAGGYYSGSAIQAFGGGGVGIYGQGTNGLGGTATASGGAGAYQPAQGGSGGNTAYAHTDANGRYFNNNFGAQYGGGASGGGWTKGGDGALRIIWPGSTRQFPSTNTANSQATITVPSAPIIGTATLFGTTAANVSYTAPENSGNDYILSYTATSNTGNFSNTITQYNSGTITVTGLTPNTAYTFSVVATNNAGKSVASSVSNVVVTPDIKYYLSFNGSTYYTIASNPATLLGPMYTVECWIYPTSTAKQSICSVGGTYFYIESNSGFNLSSWTSGAAGSHWGGSLSTNTWQHVAYMLDGYGTLKGYINGVNVFTQGGAAVNALGALTIGSDAGSNNYNGYISNLRIVRNALVYPLAGFTVPTAPLYSIAGTTLLTASSSTAIDKSPNNLTMTLTGTTTVGTW